MADFLPPESSSQRLDGLTVLVVEDNFLLASDLVAALREMGAEIIGPAPSHEDGLTQAEATPRIDAALLDVNLRGEMVYRLADILLARGIPVLLVTGYDRSDLPRRFAKVPHMAKPFEPMALVRELPAVIRAAPAARRAEAAPRLPEIP